MVRIALTVCALSTLLGCGENKLEAGVASGLGPQLAQNARYAVDDLSKAIRPNPDCAAFATEAQQLRELPDAQSIFNGVRDLRERIRQANCLR